MISFPHYNVYKKPNIIKHSSILFSSFSQVGSLWQNVNQGIPDVLLDFIFKSWKALVFSKAQKLICVIIFTLGQLNALILLGSFPTLGVRHGFVPSSMRLPVPPGVFKTCLLDFILWSFCDFVLNLCASAVGLFYLFYIFTLFVSFPCMISCLTRPLVPSVKIRLAVYSPEQSRFWDASTTCFGEPGETV